MPKVDMAAARTYAASPEWGAERAAQDGPGGSRSGRRGSTARGGPGDPRPAVGAVVLALAFVLQVSPAVAHATPVEPGATVAETAANICAALKSAPRATIDGAIVGIALGISKEGDMTDTEVEKNGLAGMVASFSAAPNTRLTSQTYSAADV